LCARNSDDATWVLREIVDFSGWWRKTDKGRDIHAAGSLFLLLCSFKAGFYLVLFSVYGRVQNQS